MLTFLATLGEGTAAPMGTGTRNRLIEFTQAYLAVSLPTSCIGLAIMERTVPEWLLTLTIGIVSFYFSKRADTSSYPNGTKV